MDPRSAGEDEASPVLVGSDGPVGHVTLNRPQARNAITVALGEALGEALQRLASETDVIVVRGAGGHFSVGGDFHELERLRPGGVEAMRPLFENFGRACALIATLPVPVIAAVEGYAMAGGFELMQASDVAIVCDNAVLADNHSNFGQVPGGGGSQRLARLVGRQRALGHLLAGDRISGAQAVQWGLAYRAVPAAEFDGVVAEFAARLAGKNREALARTKHLVHAGLQRPLTDGLALELETVLGHLTGAASGAGIAQFTTGGGTRS